MRQIYAFLILCSIAVSLSSANIFPGAKFAVSPQAINDIILAIVPQALDQFKNVTLEDFEANGYKISNLTIQKMFVDANDTKFTFGNGTVTFSMESFGLEAKCHVDGSLMYLPINLDTGVSQNKSKFSFTISLHSNKSISVDACDVSIQNLHFDFSSGFIGTPLYYIAYLLNYPIRKYLSSRISQDVKNALQASFNDIYDKLPTAGPIAETPIGLNFSSVEHPTINPNFAISKIDGTFYNTKFSNALFNLSTNDLSNTIDYKSGQTLQAVLSEYTINSALNAEWLTGAMTVNLTREILFPNVPIEFTVKGIEVLFPTIKETYPNQKAELMIEIKVNKAPLVTITEGNLNVVVGMNFTMYVLGENETLSELITFDSVLDANANLTIQHWKIMPQLVNASFRDTNLIRTSVKPVNINRMESLLDVVVTWAVPICDELTLNFPLPPVPSVDLDSTVLELHDGYMRIETTPKYLPVDFRKTFGIDK